MKVTLIAILGSLRKKSMTMLGLRTASEGDVREDAELKCMNMTSPISSNKELGLGYSTNENFPTLCH